VTGRAVIRAEARHVAQVHAEVRSAAEIRGALSELLGIDVRRVQPARAGGKAGWRITAAERRVPRVPGRTDCGYQFARNVAIVCSGELRNPRHLNRWTRSIGRPRGLPPLTAEDGHQAVRLLHALKEAA
jgi:hypothetical protein